VTIVKWSFDINEFNVQSQEELMKRVENMFLSNGDIILLHEVYSHTVKALPSLIKKIKEAGFSFVTITEMIERF